MTFDDVSAVIVTRGDVDLSFTKDLPYGEVIVWDNSQQRDLKVFGRYAGAETLATRDVIYFQDDDVRFHEHEALLERYEPGILVSNMYDQWIADCGYHDLALVGLGSIMDKRLWWDAHRRYSAAYPDDERFLLDCDFVFGALTRWKRIDFGHEILDIASDDSRLWKQPGQLEGKWRSIHRARALRKVVLTMLVKDEAENIERALDSADGLFDSVLLIDTGSTDCTPEIVDRWCRQRSIDLEVLERPFLGFGASRNELLAEGRKRGEYMLLMDADEELVGGDPFGHTWPAELTHDAYLLHYDGEIDYAQPRLLSSNFPWKFDDVPVHAALDVDHPTLTPIGMNLRSPRIRHHGDARAGTRERIERQIELLTAEIEAGNDLPRHLFLRGKAYEGLGDKDKALEDYRKRARMSYGDEESYYSRFRLGVLTAEHLNDFEKAVELLFAAWKERPTRVESLRALAFYVTAIADATPYPDDDVLLVHRDLYRDRPT